MPERCLFAGIPRKQVLIPSDDYVEYTWHAPTARLYVGRPMLKTPEPGYQYPAWVMNALGGHRACIDQMIFCASRTIAGTLVDLLTQPEELKKAQMEFEEQTGGGLVYPNGSPRCCQRILNRLFTSPGRNTSIQQEVKSGGSRHQMKIVDGICSGDMFSINPPIKICIF